ncbi:MAG: DUF551 domain-containing protein [Polynucleobacter sp.]
MSEWIKLDEQFPDDGRIIVATRTGCGEALAINHAYILSLGDGNDFTNKVTHWMPLPELPK